MVVVTKPRVLQKSTTCTVATRTAVFGAGTGSVHFPPSSNACSLLHVLSDVTDDSDVVEDSDNFWVDKTFIGHKAAITSVYVDQVRRPPKTRLGHGDKQNGVARPRFN